MTNSMTLAGALWPAREAMTAEWARRATLAIGGSVALAVSAKLQVPLGAVPFTMQTMVVLVIGMAFGWRLGAATVALYLAEGAVGLPVFAHGGGLAYMLGPTGGFLLGFLLAAAVTGFLAERGWGRTFAPTICAMLLGTVVIFACGLAWLGYLIGWDKAVAAGLMPFLISEAGKIVLAAILMPTCWHFARVYTGDSS